MRTLDSGSSTPMSEFERNFETLTEMKKMLESRSSKGRGIAGIKPLKY